MNPAAAAAEILNRRNVRRVCVMTARAVRYLHDRGRPIPDGWREIADAHDRGEMPVGSSTTPPTIRDALIRRGAADARG